MNNPNKKIFKKATLSSKNKVVFLSPFFHQEEMNLSLK